MEHENFIKVKNSSPAGDLIAMLAGLKELHKRTGKKVIIYQRLNMKGIGYQGATHKFIDNQGDPVAMNDYMFNFLKPLIIDQYYIHDFIIYEGQQFEFDLDKARQETFTNQPRGSLNRWIFYVFPQMATDLSRKWILVPVTDMESNATNKIIINFTDRYRNYLLNYFFLKKYEPYLIFAGLFEEYEQFCEDFNIEIPYLMVENAFELSQAIKNCKFFLGNQSFCFQLAESMKKPRLLEISPNLPNVIPIGENAFDYYHQSHLEYYFEYLFNNC